MVVRPDNPGREALDNVGLARSEGDRRADRAASVRVVLALAWLNSRHSQTRQTPSTRPSLRQSSRRGCGGTRRTPGGVSAIPLASRLTCAWRRLTWPPSVVAASGAQCDQLAGAPGVANSFIMALLITLGGRVITTMARSKSFSSSWRTSVPKPSQSTSGALCHSCEMVPNLKVWALSRTMWSAQTAVSSTCGGGGERGESQFTHVAAKPGEQSIVRTLRVITLLRAEPHSQESKDSKTSAASPSRTCLLPTCCFSHASPGE